MRNVPNSNSILVIKPYLFNGLWVFDDERTGLFREAFVPTATEIIDGLLAKANIPKNEVEKGFNLIFSAGPFPSYDGQFVHDGEEFNGNWYKNEETNQRGWLCPALFKYFDTAPKNLYAKALRI